MVGELLTTRSVTVGSITPIMVG